MFERMNTCFKGAFLALAGALLLLSQGCVTEQLTIRTAEKSSVSIVTWDDLNGGGEFVGDTPQTLPLERVQGKVVKVTAPGRVPQYWVVMPQAGPELEANVALSPIPPETAVAGQPGAGPNRSHRLLLKAYHALTTQDLRLARELADRLTVLEPELAAPLIVTGLVDIAEGKKDSARIAFGKAKALDPEDKDIDELIKLVP